MTVSPFDQLACPLDGEPLQRAGNTWRCAQGHSFDVARQGYVNLLPVQKKKSRDPGDSKAMVVARQSFLGAGFYQPIADAVAAALLDDADIGTATGTGTETSTGADNGTHTRGGADVIHDATLSCLDAGCGEGYYLRQLASKAHSQSASHTQSAPPLTLLGLDISKWAVQSAARQDKRMSWVVGNNANLPVLPGSLDRVLCLFGFPVYAEFLRVLKPGGRLVMADTGPDHLRELREIIYPVVKEGRTEPNQVPEGFRLVKSEQVRFSLLIPNAEQIENLLVMTPHLYRASAEGVKKAQALAELRVTVDVRLTELAPR